MLSEQNKISRIQENNKNPTYFQKPLKSISSNELSIIKQSLLKKPSLI